MPRGLRLSRNSAPGAITSNSKEGAVMAENTDWFEQLTTEEAKQDRIIFGVWAARLGILLTLLCVVAYATMA